MTGTWNRLVVGALFVVGVYGCKIGSLFSGGGDDALQPTSADNLVTPLKRDAEGCVLGGSSAPRIRRLTQAEYANTLKLWLPTPPVVAFPDPAVVKGYNNNADAMQVSEALAQQLFDDTAGLAAQIFPSAMMLCSGAAQDDACARSTLKAFASKAYRRPAADDEVATLMTVFAAGKDGATFLDGIRLAAQAALQSPNMLYVTELGDDPKATSRTLSGYEIASQLSYLFTQGPPDDALLAAAASGALATADGRRMQATRLLTAATAKPAFADFARQWLEFYKADTISRETDRFPTWSDALKEEMRAEPGDFFSSVMLEGDGSLKTLFTANWTIAGPLLRQHYGLPAGAAGAAKVTWTDAGRVGVLGQASFLTSHSVTRTSSPTRRGAFVRKHLMCGEIPPPPATLVVGLPVEDPLATTRQIYEGHMNNASCSGCHRLMDPIGFGFEKFDAIGRFRTTENGKAVDDSAQIQDVKQMTLAATGVADIATKVLGISEVAPCFTDAFFTFALARPTTKDDQCALKTAMAPFEAGTASMRDSLLAWVASDHFVNRQIQSTTVTP